MRLIYALCFCWVACDQHETVKQNSQQTQQVSAKVNYQQSIAQRDSIKLSCKRNHTTAPGGRFTEFVIHHIFPYWYGTDWDFNGVTEEPLKGKIACGYFVTTVLRDAGYPIQRIKMAQCASLVMIKSLTNKLDYFSNSPYDEFIQKVSSRGKGLYVIGLDCHTGFLYHDGKELFFIHASYLGERQVVKEKAALNSILKQSKFKVVGYLSLDEKFISRWLNSQNENTHTN